MKPQIGLPITKLPPNHTFLLLRECVCLTSHSYGDQYLPCEGGTTGHVRLNSTLAYLPHLLNARQYPADDDVRKLRTCLKRDFQADNLLQRVRECVRVSCITAVRSAANIHFQSYSTAISERGLVSPLVGRIEELFARLS